MRIIRIYQEGLYQVGEHITLSPSAAQHVGIVLRLKVGETITLFNGNNCECVATIHSVQKKNVIVRIDEHCLISRESPRSIHLIQALAKGDKMDWIIQKAVELGVASVTPLITERCAVRLDSDRLLKKHLHWQAIIIAACEQSGRNQIPMLYPSCSLDDYLNQSENTETFILSPKATNPWPVISDASIDITLMIGPEGGFSEQEIEQSLRAGAQAIQLGPRILRTETAAVTALGIAQMRYGDL